MGANSNGSMDSGLALSQVGRMNRQQLLTDQDATVIDVTGMEGKPCPLLIQELCKELNTNQIVYCHWKSNAALDRSASGDNDLDLLVRREHVSNFTEIFNPAGF